MLHVRCGDDVLVKLSAAGIPGRRLRYVDPVAQGPVPATADEAGLRRVRAAFIERAYGVPADQALAAIEAEADGLARAAEEDEVVLWFEHDLFDQAILVRALDALAPAAGAGLRVTLVSPDHQPGVERFVGLGQLAPVQLASLFERRRVVPAAAYALASRAWRALRQPDPTGLAELARSPGPELPYLARALTRLLQELPWVSDGLGLTERLALRGLAAGAQGAGALFAAAQEQERAPWMGDLMFFHVLREMEEREPPLLTAGGSWPAFEENSAPPVVALSGEGRAIVEGRADCVRDFGIDRWVGGVRLEGQGPCWRWDPATRGPVES
jgi:hypothetical protein